MSNTDPPPRKEFSSTVNQWAIFDAYQEDALNKEKMAKAKVKSN